MKHRLIIAALITVTILAVGVTGYCLSDSGDLFVMGASPAQSREAFEAVDGICREAADRGLKVRVVCDQGLERILTVLMRDHPEAELVTADAATEEALMEGIQRGQLVLHLTAKDAVTEEGDLTRHPLKELQAGGRDLELSFITGGFSITPEASDEASQEALSDEGDLFASCSVVVPAEYVPWNEVLEQAPSDAPLCLVHRYYPYESSVITWRRGMGASPEDLTAPGSALDGAGDTEPDIEVLTVDATTVSGYPASHIFARSYRDDRAIYVTGLMVTAAEQTTLITWSRAGEDDCAELFDRSEASAAVVVR